jgi:hypothetical protein
MSERMQLAAERRTLDTFPVLPSTKENLNMGKFGGGELEQASFGGGELEQAAFGGGEAERTFGGGELEAGAGVS